MLSKRLVSGLVLTFVIFGLVYIGGIWMTLFVFVVFGIGLVEFAQLLERKGYRVFRLLMFAWLALFTLHSSYPDLGLLEPGMSLLLIITFARSILRFRQGGTNSFIEFALTLTGSFYIGWLGTHFISLRALDDGLYWTFTAMVATVSADSGAYMIGSLIGKHKLMPEISPGKTWEGYIGGIISALIMTAGAIFLWQRMGASEAVSLTHGLIIGGIISVFGPIGDLGISTLKRFTGAKNTGKLIPGHGGVLDRVDVQMISIAMAYYYLTLLVL